MSDWLIAQCSDPVAGETECGDIVAGVPRSVAAGEPPAMWLVVIDGLGHGVPAALAARLALACVQADAVAPGADGDPQRLLRQLNTALVGTRGAAIGLVHLQAGRLRHAGVGNTRALRWRDGQALRLPSHYGIVGDLGGTPQPPAHTPAETPLDLLAGDWLLLFTDGLDERLQLPVMLPEWRRAPLLLCQHLMQRWRAPRDDAAVLACQVLAP